MRKHHVISYVITGLACMTGRWGDGDRDRNCMTSKIKLPVAQTNEIIIYDNEALYVTASNVTSNSTHVSRHLISFF